MPHLPPTALFFFALCFVYVWLRLEPSVHWSASCPVFFLSADFFGPFLAYPGGLLDYAAAFLAQLSALGWLGAVVLTAQALVTFLLTQWVFMRLCGRAHSMAALGPGFLLLGMYDRYPNLTLALGLGLMAAMSLTLTYQMVPGWGGAPRLAACWALAFGLGYAAGLWPCILYLALSGGIEFRLHRRWATGIACLASAVLSPAVFIVLGQNRVLNPWERGHPVVLAVAVFAMVPALSLALALLPQHWPAGRIENQSRPGGKRGSKNAASRPTIDRSSRHPRWTSAVALLAFFAGWAGVWIAFDDAGHPLAQIERYAARREYDKLLAVAARLPTIPVPAATRLHWALYHTGRLPQDLFSYPNPTHWDLLPGKEFGLDPCRAQSQTLLELGEVNDAEHLAHEALETEGDRPELLRLLAQINILDDRPRAARVFLNLLREVPFQGGWAASCLEKLEANPRLTEDEQLTRIRGLMVTNDLPHGLIPTDSILRQLLFCNPSNRMAFEYLVVHYLLTLEIHKLIDQLASFRAFGYLTLPRHVEEAILVHERRTGASVDLHGYQLHPETVRKFHQFCDAISQHAQDTPEGRAGLTRDFGDTYWAYYYTRPQPIP